MPSQVQEQTQINFLRSSLQALLKFIEFHGSFFKTSVSSHISLPNSLRATRNNQTSFDLVKVFNFFYSSSAHSRLIRNLNGRTTERMYCWPFKLASVRSDSAPAQLSVSVRETTRRGFSGSYFSSEKIFFGRSNQFQFRLVQIRR